LSYFYVFIILFYYFTYFSYFKHWLVSVLQVEKIISIYFEVE
jgi:hypothetical protein